MMGCNSNENNFFGISCEHREFSVTLTVKENLLAVSFFQFRKRSFSNKDRSLLLLCRN